MPSSVLNRANLLGSQLGTFRQDVDRLQRAPKELVTDLLAVMQESHRAYVSRNYANNLPAELRKSFEELDPRINAETFPRSSARCTVSFKRTDSSAKCSSAASS